LDTTLQHAKAHSEIHSSFCILAASRMESTHKCYKTKKFSLRMINIIQYFYKTINENSIKDFPTYGTVISPKQYHTANDEKGFSCL
jgi:hypothetical protein